MHVRRASPFAAGQCDGQKHGRAPSKDANMVIQAMALVLARKRPLRNLTSIDTRGVLCFRLNHSWREELALINQTYDGVNACLFGFKRLLFDSACLQGSRY